MNEFEIIDKYFSLPSHRKDVITSVGDDAAIVQPQSGHELAITTDTLVAGVHFFDHTQPYDIGYKSLAVNLSDLAAMGAEPAWLTLSLTLPQASDEWLSEFTRGFLSLANIYNAQLIGGNLSHGQLAITIQAIGYVPQGQAILRSGAKVTDLIYVSGYLGDAGLALCAEKKEFILDPDCATPLLNALYQPNPRIALGVALRSIATAAIDISDGLAADLSHLLDASKVGAEVRVDQIPLSIAMTRTLPQADGIAFALNSGDDYELCFTVPAHKQEEAEKIFTALAIPCTCIGRIVEQPGLQLIDQNGKTYHGAVSGYQHF